MISQQILTGCREIFEFKNNENSEQNISIYDTENNVLLYSAEFTPMRHLSANYSIRCNGGPTRIFSNAGNKVYLEIYSNIQTEIGHIEPKALNERLKQRLYREASEKLHRDLKLVQYNPGKANIFGQIFNKDKSRDEALKDLRELINQHGKESVCLWDPFLSADDVINTLFYNQNCGAIMRAITRIKVTEDNSKSKTELIQEYKEKLSQACICPYGLSVEFRSTLGGTFADFHDRFLIFPDVKPRPLVWSLGTSVNSMGKSHHLLLQLQHGQMIVDAFEQMWAESDKPKQLIWKSPDQTTLGRDFQGNSDLLT